APCPIRSAGGCMASGRRSAPRISAWRGRGMPIGPSSARRLWAPNSMGPPHPLLRLLSAAGIGAMSWIPAAAGAETASATHAKYRPDIDGLRALAGVPVVLSYLHNRLVY